MLILLVLISFIQAKRITLESKFLDTDKELELSNSDKFLVCVHIKEDLPKDDNFFIIIKCEESGKKIDKKFRYEFLENTCKDEKLDIDLSNLKENFSEVIENINSESEDNGFVYEYELKKKEDKQKYMRMLIQNFDGEKMTIIYSKMSISTLIIIIAVSVAVGIFVIVAIIIIIVCCICHKKRVASVQQQYQSSFVNDQIIPRDSNVD